MQDVLRIKCTSNESIASVAGQLNSTETNLDSLYKIINANESKLLFDIIINLLDLSLPSKVTLECRKAQYNFLMPIVLSNKKVLEKKYLNQLIRVYHGGSYRWAIERGMLLHIIKSAELTKEYGLFIKNLSKNDLEFYEYIIKWFVKK